MHNYRHQLWVKLSTSLSSESMQVLSALESVVSSGEASLSSFIPHYPELMKAGVVFCDENGEYKLTDFGRVAAEALKPNGGIEDFIPKGMPIGYLDDYQVSSLINNECLTSSIYSAAGRVPGARHAVFYGQIEAKKKADDNHCPDGNCVAGHIGGIDVFQKDWLFEETKFLGKIDLWNELTKRWAIPHIGFIEKYKFCPTCGRSIDHPKFPGRE